MAATRKKPTPTQLLFEKAISADPDVMVKFDDTNEEQQDSHIERAATAITAIFRRAEKKLKAISADTDFSGPQRTKGKEVRGSSR